MKNILIQLINHVLCINKIQFYFMHQKGINFALNTSSGFVVSPNKYLENMEL